MRKPDRQQTQAKAKTSKPPAKRMSKSSARAAYLSVTSTASGSRDSNMGKQQLKVKRTIHKRAPCQQREKDDDNKPPAIHLDDEDVEVQAISAGVKQVAAREPYLFGRWLFVVLFIFAAFALLNHCVGFCFIHVFISLFIFILFVILFVAYLRFDLSCV